MRCIVRTCNSPSDRHAILPMDTERRLLWLQILRREDLLYSKGRHLVCYKHFKPEMIVPSGRCVRTTAIPFLNDAIAPAYNPVFFQILKLNSQNRLQSPQQGKANSNSADSNDTVSIMSANSIKIEEDIEYVDIDKFDFDNPPANEVHIDNVPSPSLENSVPVQAELYENPYAELYEKACNDDILSFGLYVASKLKAFNNPYFQATAKHHISRVIFNIELKQYQVINKNLPSAHEEFQKDLESLQ